MSCAEGKIRIKNAFYGRQNTKTCVNRKYGDSWITSCNSDVTQVIKSVCENKTNYIILANTQSLNVPDPCPFISKYVQVRYSCEKIGEIWYYFVAYSVFVAILL